MPINEIESHPYLDYLGINPAYQNYSAVVIGSFPVYSITESAPNAPVGITIRNDWAQYAHVQFFYGSNRNQFWNRLSLSLTGLLIADYQLESLLGLLNAHRFLITDCLSATFRIGYSASDKHLIPSLYNHEILNLLESMDGGDIFMTAMPNGVNSPFRLLKEILLQNHLFHQGMMIPIADSRNITFHLFDKVFRIGFLFSPSPQGAINGVNVVEFQNYLVNHQETRYAEFVKVQWRQLLYHRNFAFDGTNEW